MLTLAIPHMNYMHYQLTTSAKIMQENMGKNIAQQVCKPYTKETWTEIERNISSNEVI